MSECSINDFLTNVKSSRLTYTELMYETPIKPVFNSYITEQYEIFRLNSVFQYLEKYPDIQIHTYNFVPTYDETMSIYDYLKLHPRNIMMIISESSDELFDYLDNGMKQFLSENISILPELIKKLNFPAKESCSSGMNEVNSEKLENI